MNTKLEYLGDTYLFSQRARVYKTGRNEFGNYLILEQTIFYPQGGGQPSDKGIISSQLGEYPIYKVQLKEETVFHYTQSEISSSLLGELVTCRIDSVLRLKHAACHTAGHLIANCVEKLQPSIKAVKAYHFLEGPYIEFKGIYPDKPEELILELGNALQTSLSQSLMIETEITDKTVAETTHGFKTFRTVQIGNYEKIPCGGTHIKELTEIKNIKLSQLKKTKEGFRISYSTLIHEKE